MSEEQIPKQTIFENRMAIISSAIALVTVFVAAIGLIPDMKVAFFNKNESVELSEDMTGRKVQCVVEDIADKYFDDTLVEIFEPGDDGKLIRTVIYAFNDDQVNVEKIVEMGEEIYEIASKEDAGVCALRFSLITHTITQSAPGLENPVFVPAIIFLVDKTTTLEGETIWVSFLMKTVFFSHKDLMQYEYEKSEIFKKIDIKNYDLKETHYWEDNESHIYRNQI